MRVLISQRVFVNRHGIPCEYLEEPYVSYFLGFGIDLYPVSNFRPNDSYLTLLGQVDGVILSGGNDVDARLYREEPLPGNDSFPGRDRTEKELIDFAVRKKIPLFAVCRGMQFLNVHFGGSLIQDIERQTGRAHPPGADHDLIIVDSAAKDYFREDRWRTNSYHCQAVTPERLSPCLKPFVLTPDQMIVEGLYHRDLPIAGVQFHPERTRDAEQIRSQKRIVDAFVNGELFWARR